MSILWRLLIGVGVGLAGHQSDKLLTQTFGNEQIGRLAHYSTGLLMVIGVYALLNARHDHATVPLHAMTPIQFEVYLQRAQQESLADVVLAAVTTGLGVLGGYVIDNVRGKR